MPAKVDELFDEVKKSNPSYSDEQAWATAWSIYCKHVNPSSESCHMPSSEYLKGKSASERVLGRFLTASLTEEEAEKAIRASEGMLKSLEDKKDLLPKDAYESFREAIKSNIVKYKKMVKTAGWEGKLVGKDFRLKWSYYSWNLEELPAKGKRKLRVATMRTYLEIGHSEGVNSSPLIQENILKDAHISTSDSYDNAKAKLLAAFKDAANRVMASAGESGKFVKYILDNDWDEDTVHFLQVTPENVEPFVAKGKDFSVSCEWTKFRSYSPGSDLDGGGDPHYTIIQSTAPAAARKLYQMLRAAPDALRSIPWDKFDDFLKANKVNYEYQHSVWH